jgi:hypothetical protein
MKASAKVLWAPLLVGAMVFLPSVVQASLIGDTVTATLTDTDAPFTIFTASAVVTGSVTPEFSGSFNSIDWTLDILDNGFVLHADCSTFNGCDSGAISLAISGLDFTPPADLVALSNIIATDPLLSAADPPVITPSSVTVTFQSFSLGTGGLDPPKASSYAADFSVESRVVPTPFPATLLLLGAGLSATGILAAWRRLS